MKTTPPVLIQLSNKIPVLLQPFEGAVAATYWWVKTGSADEKSNEAGYAHFLEHMLFKDAAAKETGKASHGQLARMIESLGGDINAYTSFDQTVYHVTCAAQHWEKILDAFGTMAKPQKFLKSDFEREREVILEELRKNEDSPGRQLFQGLFSQTYRKHPYGKPVIGTVKSLKAATVSSVEGFYRRQYVSENMGLLLVGPSATLGDSEHSPQRKKLVALLEKRFGSRVISAKKAVAAPTRTLEPQTQPEIGLQIMEFDVKTPSLSVSFRVPELEHPDAAAIDLLASILGMGELGRLYQALFYGKKCVTDVSAGVYVPKDPGMLYAELDYEDVAQTESVFGALMDELARIQSVEPTEEELKRVMTAAESERLYATQSADGMAGRLGFLQFVLNDLAYDGRYLEELRQVDSFRIQEIAKRYLCTSRMAIVVMVPKGQLAQVSREQLVELARQKLGVGELFEAPAKSKAKAKTADQGGSDGVPAQVWTLANGIQVALFERPQSHVFSMQATVLGGIRLEQDSEMGGSHMLSQTWTKGTESKSAQQIARIVEGLAAGLDGFSGRNSAGLQMTGLTKDFDALSELFWEVLWKPSFSEGEIELSRKVTEDAIRGIEDSSAQLCSRLFLETLFEKHPYRRNVYGTLESVAKLNSEALSGLHRRWMRPDGLSLAISGAVSRRKVERWLAKIGAAQVQPRFAVDASQGGLPSAIRLQDEADLSAPRWVERHLGREQVHVLVGGLGTRLHSDERFAMRLLSNLLSGQSGRLFVELREKKSLAYTVSPSSFEGMERGYVGTYMASAPGKREEALKGIRSVLEKLAQKGPTAQEMKRAQEFYLGRRAMDLQTDTALATHFGLELVYHLPLLSDAEIAKRVRAVTAEQVRVLCDRYLVQAPQVTAVVG